MTSIHILLYASLTGMIIFVLYFLYRSLQIAIFDKEYAKTIGVPMAFVDGAVFFLLILAIIIGIRSVGVVLMAGMLIAPAIAARQFCDRLYSVFVLSGFFGAFSGFFGNYLSLEIPKWGIRQGWEWKFTLPTGPMILLSATAICFIAFLFAPKSGFVRRRIRAAYFRRECQKENLLKHLWKQGEGHFLSLKELKKSVDFSRLRVFWMLFCLKHEGWIEKKAQKFGLTSDGCKRAGNIVRLHRLWEVYLVNLGQGVEKVHHSAEEMEHILTPEIEQELTILLNNPKYDPHRQPIPSRATFSLSSKKPSIGERST